MEVAPVLEKAKSVLNKGQARRTKEISGLQRKIIKKGLFILRPLW